MSGYIDRDFLERRIHETMDMQDLYLPIHFIQLMDELDDADVVEVVRCKDCKRNADNGGLYPNGRTQCPIQEHYALLQDGYCHLGECKEVQRIFNASNTLDALETEVTE